MTSRTAKKSITVTGGALVSGVIDLPQFSGYDLKILCIDAPAAAVYSWVLRDAEGYALAGATNANGDQTYYYSIPALGPLSLTILAGATDGVYATKTGVDFKS